MPDTLVNPAIYDRHAWIIRMLMDGPLSLRQIHAASTATDHGTLDRLMWDLHLMVDEDIITMDGGLIRLAKVPYTYVHTEVRRLQRLMDTAIRTGGLTVRQVDRMASLLVTLDEYYQDEKRTEGEE